jgi:hypothetical protein
MNQGGLANIVAAVQAAQLFQAAQLPEAEAEAENDSDQDFPPPDPYNENAGQDHDEIPEEEEGLAP